MYTKMGDIQVLFHPRVVYYCCIFKHLMSSAEVRRSPLSEKLNVLGDKLAVASILTSVVVFILGISTGGRTSQNAVRSLCASTAGRGADPESSQPVWLQMLLVAVSLSVAAVPEGLPACDSLRVVLCVIICVAL